MSAIDVLGLLVPVTFLVMMAIEAVVPARKFPPIRGWRWIGLGFLVLMGVVTTIVPLLIPEPWLAAHRLLDGTGLGVVGGALVGYLVLSGVNYVWHRTAHRFDLLWRMFHQMHHSPQRMDMGGAALFHPLEMALYAALQVAAVTLILGLDPLAAALTGYIAAFYGLFQHMNVRTPVWLGYLIQRPESHCVHHQRDVHGFNYADLPVWDLLFGTFRNPPAWEGEVGFVAGATGRYGAMLAFRDVNRDQYGPASLGARPSAA